MNVDQPLVGADLEVLAGVLVLEGATDHAVDVLLGRQRHGARDGRPGPLSRLDDRACRKVDLRMVVPLQTDSDLLLSHVWSTPSLLQDLGDGTRADGAATLANREAQALVHGDR